MSEYVRLGDVCEILNGYAFKSEMYSRKGIRIIRITNVQKGFIEDKEPQFYPIETKNVIEKYMLEENDLLISLTGNVGRVALIKSNMLPAALNQRVACLRLKTDEFIKQYIFYILNSDMFENDCILSSKGVAQKNLSTEWLKDYPIKVQSIDMQNKIINTLDKVTALIDKHKKQLEKLDELVKARFVEMFGDLYLNKKNFEKCYFSKYIMFITSGSRGWSKYFTSEGEYFITIKNVNNGKICVDNVQHVVPPCNAEAKRTRVKEGDLLISITADLGRTGVVSKEIATHGGYINQHLTCIRLNKEKLNPIYVAHYMESDVGKCQFESKNQNAVKAGLNFNAIKSLKIVVPPIELQNQFADFVKQVEETKAEVQKSLEKTETLKKSLMQKYFG